MSTIINFVIKRGISTTNIRYGKRNFRKFQIFNKRGSRQYKETQKSTPNPEIPIYKRGVRDTGYWLGDKFVQVQEKIPELIVPDLNGFELKPYVSYRTPDVIQSEFTSKDLFNIVYAPKILKDFEAGKLDEHGQPLEPSLEEKMTSEEAKLKARQTGSDIF